jgi:hypothetical protein
MFSASISSDLWGAEPSALNVSGGSKRRSDGSHDFLIWALPHELALGDEVDLYFEEGTLSDPPGTIFISEPDNSMDDGARFKSWPPSEAELLDWEARPALNESLRWSFALNDGAPLLVGPDTQRQHVGLHTLWNEERPDRMRVSLSKSSLREICSRSGGEELLLAYVPVGSRVHIVVGA